MSNRPGGRALGTWQRWGRDLRAEWREGGWRLVLRRRGWQVLAAIFVFYLVRDVFLYVLLPLGLVAAMAR